MAEVKGFLTQDVTTRRWYLLPNQSDVRDFRELQNSIRRANDARNETAEYELCCLFSEKFYQYMLVDNWMSEKVTIFDFGVKNKSIFVKTNGGQ